VCLIVEKDSINSMENYAYNVEINVINAKVKIIALNAKMIIIYKIIVV